MKTQFCGRETCELFSIIWVHEKKSIVIAFVLTLGKFSRSRSRDFIVVPQNGLELAFNHLEDDQGLDLPFLAAVSGFGVEELFYDGKCKVDKYRLKMCQEIKKVCTVMVADYVKKQPDIVDAHKRNTDENFLCFPRGPKNYDYKEIPADPDTCRPQHVMKLSDAKNYLYLINPENFSNRQSMFRAVSATNYDVIIMDAFFGDELWPHEELCQLKTKANGGKRLAIAYMNVGAAEKFRFYWQKDWKLGNPTWLKKKYDGYNDEIWVEFWEKEWKDIILYKPDSYINRILAAGFDGVYLDNVEAYYTLYFD